MHKVKSKDALQPLFAAVLKALTPDDIEVCFYDDRIEEIPFDEPTDLVGISIETFCAQRSYQIAYEYRKRGVKVIAGGFHPSLLPDETLEYVDSVLIGDAEYTWHKVIEDLRKGRLKPLYINNNESDEIDIKFDRSIFANKSYGPVEMVQWGRGCPHNCDFCSIKAFYKSKHYCRSIEDVINEISGLKRKTIFFVDDNLYFNKGRFKEFLIALVPMKLRWTCQVSINIAQDDELLKLMADSGCFMALVGIESFNPDNLKLMNKQWNTAKLNYDATIRKFNSYGIMIYGTFIFGYDFDTADSFKYAIDFALKYKFFIANFNPLYPMPGTALYQRLEKEKRLLFDRWWLDPGFYYGKSMFYPKSMSPDELEEKCFETKREFNSWKSILQRSLNPIIMHKSFQKTLLYFYANIINRREVYKKQGKGLGL